MKTNFAITIVEDAHAQLIAPLYRAAYRELGLPWEAKAVVCENVEEFEVYLTRESSKHERQGFYVSEAFRQRAAELCTVLDPIAHGCWIADTLLIERSEADPYIIGYNAKGRGALEALAEIEVDIPETAILVYGSGNSAASVFAALLEAGATNAKMAVTEDGVLDQLEGIAVLIDLHVPDPENDLRTKVEEGGLIYISDEEIRSEQFMAAIEIWTEFATEAEGMGGLLSM